MQKLVLFLIGALMSVGAETTFPTLNFFVVHDRAIAGGKFIDTADFPKLGYIGNVPDLIVTNLQAVTLTNATTTVTINGKSTRYTQLARIFHTRVEVGWFSVGKYAGARRWE
jgi:hypothetical protein